MKDLSGLRRFAIHYIGDMYPGANIAMLCHNVTNDGTFTAVYEVDGVRHYHATEYTRCEDGHWEQCGGYDTIEKYHYMGQRYRTLFGPYEDEVFYNTANPNA